MIWQANQFDKYFTFWTIFLSCLKFWDSKLLIKAYFGSTSEDELMERINKKIKALTNANKKKNKKGNLHEFKQSKLEVI